MARGGPLRARGFELPSSFLYSSCVARSGKSERNPQSSASGASAGELVAVEHLPKLLRVRVAEFSDVAASLGRNFHGGLPLPIDLREKFAVAAGQFLHRGDLGRQRLAAPAR